MNIACISWGSLIWAPEPLKLATPWHPDGPLLPLEFVRDSDDSEELAIVLHESAPPVPTYWAMLDTHDIGAAREMLRQREKIRIECPQFVGSIPDPHEFSYGAVGDVVAAWMRERGIDGVVWTALPAKFAKVSERAPSAHEAVAFLDGMRGEQRRKAEEYVRKVPQEIRTLYRTLFEQRLGWTPEA
ncbi:hypothetical protein HH212_20685 [Massilia forsythiae]|uniref:Uncharacterized protein n=1 Tax=Massilia forsythiae TaxID=2728020 RepID=A0A7Z2W0D9_9BURK|nr:hypothetical protein [Massilia forsythiae]QJE02135.1 hypothetical protein HH212_20685 [Massilia forsythiae]